MIFIKISNRIDELKEKFNKCGKVGDVYIPRNFQTNQPRGFAFIRFVDRSEGEEAMRALDGADLDGRTLRIQEAKDRRPDNPRSYMLSRLGRYQDRG